MATVKQIFTIPAGIKWSKSSMEILEICLKLTSKAPERRQLYNYVVFLDNFEHILNLVLALFILLIFNTLPR